MPAYVDHPRPGVPFDPAEFWINGWLWLEERHAQLAAVEAWHDDKKLGAIEASALFKRPDVSAQYGIAAGVATGFAFAARYPNAPTRPFGLSLRGRLRDGSLTEPIVTSEVTPPSPEHDPLGALRTRLPPTARGLEIGAHARPVKGLAPYFTDAVASFAGTSGRVDFLADALALPLPDNTLEYLCSSHVLEHLPNPLAALHEWYRVLQPGGWLYLVVPDKRYTFDVRRPLTTTKHFLGDFLPDAPPADSAVHVDEFVFQTDWGKLRPDCPPAERAAQQARVREQYLGSLHRGEPIDIHFHTFIPDSLRALLHAAGFIGGSHSRFELVMEAERYPPDRIDGIAYLLRKRGGGEASRNRPRLRSRTPTPPSRRCRSSAQLHSNRCGKKPPATACSHSSRFIRVAATRIKVRYPRSCRRRECVRSVRGAAARGGSFNLSRQICGWPSRAGSTEAALSSDSHPIRGLAPRPHLPTFVLCPPWPKSKLPSRNSQPLRCASWWRGSPSASS